jgi:hypothetical protein
LAHHEGTKYTKLADILLSPELRVIRGGQFLALGLKGAIKMTHADRS